MLQSIAGLLEMMGQFQNICVGANVRVWKEKIEIAPIYLPNLHSDLTTLSLNLGLLAYIAQMFCFPCSLLREIVVEENMIILAMTIDT